jgi:uncharacterized DUF497 family protein
MNYQWDKAKATTNRRKHGVRFADAVTIFDDESAITIEDDDLEEERFVTIGLDNLRRILVVVYTYRDDEIKIISARKATIFEEQYYQGTL